MTGTTSTSKSFLKSGPGILTALATLVAAIAGLVTALSQFSGGGSAGPAVTQAAPVRGATTTVVAESAAQRELRAHIPRAIWPTCGSSVDSEPGSVASFNCKYREIVGVQYNLYASSQELNTAYKAVKRRYGLAAKPGGRSCGSGKFEGAYRSGGSAAGHFVCFIDDRNRTAAIVWTRDGLGILSFAWRSDGNLAALFEAWQSGVVRGESSS